MVKVLQRRSNYVYMSYVQSPYVARRLEAEQMSKAGVLEKRKNTSA